MNELTARVAAATALARYDTNAVVDAAIAMDSEEFLLATSTFVAPGVSLSADELELAATQTAAAIAAIEAQAAAVAEELHHLLQTGNGPSRETGTRVDFAG